MKATLSITFLFLFGLINSNLLGQESPIYKLEKILILGDKAALFEIAPFFDSKEKITEFLGHHILERTESQIAKRIIEENCIFTDNEIKISEKTTSKQFLAFLSQNREKIFFSKVAEAFFLIPLENRVVKFDIREIPKNRKIELENKWLELKNLDWVKRNKIDSLIERKDSKALLLISSEFYKIRYRFNKYYYTPNEFTDLLQFLTGTEIAIENGLNKLTWHIDKEFNPTASLNLLIYFSNNYKNYKWDEENSIFINSNYKAKSIGKEETLFQLLNSKNDSIALDAFTQLTTCDSQNVIRVSDEFDKARIGSNFTIPTFPYRFLKQLVVLTKYCKDNNIDFIGTTELKNDIEKLTSKISFQERRKLEDKLINTLTLDEITAFEYWALIKEKSYKLTHSAGRILDIFYSKNWNKLINNDKQLQLYLKKSILFDRLGIIGICNNYLRKFQNSNSSTIEKLNALQTDDVDIKRQVKLAKSIGSIKLKKPNIPKKEFDGNKDFVIIDFVKEFNQIQNNDIEEYENEITKLLSKINYSQIGIALKSIEDIKFKSAWKNKYSFVERDFGFFMIEDFSDISKRNDFLKIYNTLSEYDLYSYYLDQSGIDYKNKDNSLDYDKIYELLKYDAVVAFVGGGGTRDNDVYSLIKLLEIKHKTTLGFPNKLCNSNGMYGCDSDDRTKEWMQYFIDKKLLKKEHTEPISFHNDSNVNDEKSKALKQLINDR